jgi:site-specific DNA recombinase
VPNPTEQATLARPVESRQQGLGYLKIATALTEEGRRTKRGGPWQAMTVRNLFLRATEEATA